MAHHSRRAFLAGAAATLAALAVSCAPGRPADLPAATPLPTKADGEALRDYLTPGGVAGRLVRGNSSVEAALEAAANALLEVGGGGYAPHRIVAVGEAGAARVRLLAGKEQVDHSAAVYVCSGATCHPPVTEPGRLRELLS